VDPESVVRGNPALDGCDRVRNNEPDFPSSAAMPARGKTFGRVQDIAGRLQLEDLALRSVGIAQVEDLVDEARGIAGPRGQVVRRCRSFPGPPPARRWLLRGRLLFTSLGSTSGRPHLFLHDPLLKVGTPDPPAIASAA